MGGGREMTIFCVDVSSSMANLRTIDIGHSSEKTTQQITNLEYGLEVVKARVADMLIGGLKTVHCGIVLFGSDHTENSLADSGYEFIWEYMIPAQPTTATLKQIADIPLHLSQKHAPNKGDLLSALIFCDYLLGESLGKKKWTRKIVMITDAASETIWKGSKSQRDRMEKDDIELTVVGLDFDEPDIGYLEPNKSETKSENERRLYKLCRSLQNGSTCVTALLAVPDAHLPRPHIPGTNPTPVTLSIGALDPEQVTEESYEPSHTLRIECHLRKCTTIVRPKSMKKMSRFGIKTEQAKIRRMNGPSTTGELIDHFMAEEDEEEEPLGLLQVERKYVYGPQEKPVKPKEQKTRGANSDSSSDDSDSSYDEAVPLREADKERLAKAYKYGATLVVIDNDDLEQIRESFDTSLQIRGFLRLTDVPRQHLLNDVNYLVANPTDGHGQLAFSAVVRALAIEGLVASARYVSRSVGAEPKMVVLFPMIEKDLLYFLMVQVPFAEDHREYFFPSLESVRTRAGKQLDVHKNLPTEEMEHAMDDFVEVLGADDEEDVKAEDGVSERWLDIENTCSPAVHYMKACLSYRLSHPESTNLPTMHPSLKRSLEPPAQLKERAKPSLERLKQLLDVKPVAKRAKTRRKVDQTLVDPDIDIDSMLRGVPMLDARSQVIHAVDSSGKPSSDQKPFRGHMDSSATDLDPSRGDWHQVDHTNGRSTSMAIEEKSIKFDEDVSESSRHNSNQPDWKTIVKTESPPSD